MQENSGTELKEGFNQKNNPFNFAVPQAYWENSWDRMPMSGSLENTDSHPWSGDYWAYPDDNWTGVTITIYDDAAHYVE